jgi:hypothetical protein
VVDGKDHSMIDFESLTNLLFSFDPIPELLNEALPNIEYYLYVRHEFGESNLFWLLV